MASLLRKPHRSLVSFTRCTSQFVRASRFGQPIRGGRPLATTVKVRPPPLPSLPSRRSAAPKRSLRPYLYATSFLLLGLTAGSFVRFTLVPPKLPAPHTPPDDLLVKRLRETSDALPIVRFLRSAPDHWREWDAYSSFTAKEQAGRLSSGPMGGGRGLAVQRIFWNEEERKAVTVVFFGGGLTGWVGVTHGGAIATVMDESLGRVALRLFPAKTGVTANLHLEYRAPTLANQFYVLRAEAVEGETTDRKAKIQGSLETIDGKVCVEATGVFVVPKNIRLKEIEDGF